MWESLSTSAYNPPCGAAPHPAPNLRSHALISPALLLACPSDPGVRFVGTAPVVGATPGPIRLPVARNHGEFQWMPRAKLNWFSQFTVCDGDAFSVSRSERVASDMVVVSLVHKIQRAHHDRTSQGSRCGRSEHPTETCVREDLEVRVQERPYVGHPCGPDLDRE